MDLARLKALIELVGSAGLADFELTEGDVRVRIKAFRRPASVGTTATAQIAPDRDLEGPVRPEAANTHAIVRAPLSGTFFTAPAPAAPPFHRIGDRVGRDSVLCIIEAMKTMTHIPAGYDGTLRKVLVENGVAVEFGQPLFEIS